MVCDFIGGGLSAPCNVHVIAEAVAQWTRALSDETVPQGRDQSHGLCRKLQAMALMAIFLVGTLCFVRFGNITLAFLGNMKRSNSTSSQHIKGMQECWWDFNFVCFVERLGGESRASN